jgi:hypothetical protein
MFMQMREAHETQMTDADPLEFAPGRFDRAGKPTKMCFAALALV